jgi:hypothetical protein
MSGVDGLAPCGEGRGKKAGVVKCNAIGNCVMCQCGVEHCVHGSGNGMGCGKSNEEASIGAMVGC